MIDTSLDDEEVFDRLDYFILGALLHHAYKQPRDTKIQAREMSEWSGGIVPSEAILSRIARLEELSLILRTDSFVRHPRGEEHNPFLEITAAGIALTLEKAYDIHQQIHGLTWDMPEEIAETLEELALGMRFDPFPTEHEKVAASDRYVSVKDNSAAFDEISDNLSRIKNDFARDHNKGNLKADNLDARLADIDAFAAQVRRGWVSKAVAQNLLETMLYLKEISTSITSLVVAASVVIAALKSLFGL